MSWTEKWLWIVGKHVLLATVYLTALIGTVISSIVLAYVSIVTTKRFVYGVAAGALPWLMFIAITRTVLEPMSVWAARPPKDEA